MNGSISCESHVRGSEGHDMHPLTGNAGDVDPASTREIGNDMRSLEVPEQDQLASWYC
ncbi:MAG: hypothetical protein WCA32_15220 [Chromatiaceae bacterium]